MTTLIHPLTPEEHMAYALNSLPRYDGKRREAYGLDVTSEEAAEWHEVVCLCDGGDHEAPANGEPCPRCFPQTTCKEG